jgi:hypothetical protein
MITSVSKEPATLSEDRNIERLKSQICTCTSHCIVYFACPEEKLLVPFDFHLQVYLNNISKISFFLREHSPLHYKNQPVNAISNYKIMHFSVK